jgi:hypothetical protein
LKLGTQHAVQRHDPDHRQDQLLARSDRKGVRQLGLAVHLQANPVPRLEVTAFESSANQLRRVFGALATLTGRRPQGIELAEQGLQAVAPDRQPVERAVGGALLPECPLRHGDRQQSRRHGGRTDSHSGT